MSGSERLSRSALENHGFRFIDQFIKRATVYEAPYRALEEVCKRFAQVTPLNPTLTYFTDHSYLHIRTVIGIAGMCLQEWRLWDFDTGKSPSGKLEPEDIFTLFVCCNVHDIRMSYGMRKGHEVLSKEFLTEKLRLGDDLAARVSTISPLHGSKQTKAMLKLGGSKKGLIGALLRFADCLDCTAARVGGEWSHFKNLYVPQGQIPENLWQGQIESLSICGEEVIVHGHQNWDSEFELEDNKKTRQLSEKVEAVLKHKEFLPCQKVFKRHGLNISFDIDIKEVPFKMSPPAFRPLEDLYAIVINPSELESLLNKHDEPNAYIDLWEKPKWRDRAQEVNPALYQDHLGTLTNNPRVVLRGGTGIGKSVLAVQCLLDYLERHSGARVALLRRDTLAEAMDFFESILANLQHGNGEKAILFVVDAPDEPALEKLLERLGSGRPEVRWMVTLQSCDLPRGKEPKGSKVLDLLPEMQEHRHALMEIAARAGVPKGDIEGRLDLAGYVPAAISRGSRIFQGVLCRISDQGLFWVRLISRAEQDWGPALLASLAPTSVMNEIWDFTEQTIGQSQLRIRKSVQMAQEEASANIGQKFLEYSKWRHSKVEDWEKKASQGGAKASDFAKALLSVGEYSRHVRVCSKSNLSVGDPEIDGTLRKWWLRFVEEAGSHSTEHRFEDRSPVFKGILGEALRGNFSQLNSFVPGVAEGPEAWALALLGIQAFQFQKNPLEAVIAADNLLSILGAAKLETSALHNRVSLERLDALLDTENGDLYSLGQELESRGRHRLPQHSALAKLFRARFLFVVHDDIANACQLVKEAEVLLRMGPSMYEESRLLIHAADFYAHGYLFAEATRTLEAFFSYIKFIQNEDLEAWYYGIKGDALRRERKLDEAHSAYRYDLAVIERLGNPGYKSHVKTKLAETLIDRACRTRSNHAGRVRDLADARKLLEEIPVAKQGFFFHKAILRHGIRASDARGLKTDVLFQRAVKDTDPKKSDAEWTNYQHGFANRLHAQLERRKGNDSVAAKYLEEAASRFGNFPPELAATHLQQALLEFGRQRDKEGREFITRAVGVLADFESKMEKIGYDLRSGFLSGLPIRRPLKGLARGQLIDLCEDSFAALEY